MWIPSQASCTYIEELFNVPLGSESHASKPLVRPKGMAEMKVKEFVVETAQEQITYGRYWQ